MSRLRALSSLCWAGVLVTMPWIGLETARPLLGRDLGTGLQPAYVLLAAAVALGCLGFAAGGGSRAGSPWRRRDLVLAALVLAAVALSAAGLLLQPGAAPAGERWGRYLRQAAQLVLMLAFAAQAAAWTRGGRRWEATRRLVAAGLLFQVGYAALQLVHFRGGLPWFGVPEGWFTANPAILSGSEQLFLGGGFLDVPRLRGTACEPLYLGSYLLLALPLLLLPGRSRLAVAALLGGTALLVATWARGAWIGAAVAAATVLLCRREAGLPMLPAGSGRRLAAAVALAAAGAALAFALEPDLVRLPWRRLVQSLDREDWSNLTRLYSMEAGWRAFLLSPLVGVGWGQFAFHFPLLTHPMGLQSQFTWPVVNNFPLEILCETGVAGAGVLAATVLLLGREVRLTLRDPAVPPEARRRLALVAAANAGIWVQLLTFSQYNLPHIWVAGGLLLAALAGARDREPPAGGAAGWSAAAGFAAARGSGQAPPPSRAEIPAPAEVGAADDA